MACSSCGSHTESDLDRCEQCTTGTHFESVDSSASFSDQPNTAQASKLIEFPGVTRSTVPQWRKELSERVREVQERRAREEALELALGKIEVPEATPQLELLPQAEAAPVNPLVAAALRRIERAHETATYHSNAYSRVTAVAYAEPMTTEETSPADAPVLEVAEYEPPKQVEKVHNLIVVPSPAIVESVPAPKPRRMIGDLNDPALDYLDSVRTAVRFETSGHRSASMLARFVSAVVDLTVVGLLCTPFAAAVELTNTNWESPRVWAVAAGIFIVVGFLYFTVCIALSGKTAGLRLLSLRIVDARTGLIPTGTQSAARAVIYLASLLILGLSSVFALLNPERLTAHDRITRTAVIQN